MYPHIHPRSRGGLFTRSASGAYPFLTEKLSALANAKKNLGIHYDELSSHVNKIALLKREEGIGRPLDPSCPDVLTGYNEKIWFIDNPSQILYKN